MSLAMSQGVAYAFDAPINAECFRRAGLCTAACEVRTLWIGTRKGEAAVLLEHRGQDVRVLTPFTDDTDIGYCLLDEWERLASALHREDVLVSDWPVF